MMINALNSGARVFMADLEDALSPTWANVVAGQAALIDAVRGTLAFESPEGKSYRLGDRTAQLVVRPRGWHLVESHVQVDGTPMSASLFDAGLYLFHNGAERVAPRVRAVPVPAEARVPPRSAALERGLRVRPGAARHPAWLDPGDRPDRDDHGRLRDGRDPVRAARARRRAQRRALGLPVQRHQAVPCLAGARVTRPRAVDDDRAVHARVHEAAGRDLPSARSPCDRRDGRVHPEPARPRGDRARAGQGPGGQGARVERRIRRDVGGAPRPGPARDGDLRLGARRCAEPEDATA